MWYLVLSRIVEGAEEARKVHLQEHMDWLLATHRAGHILFSGPTPDKETGIYVMLAADVAEASQIAGSDPHHLYGERKMEVIEWDVQRTMQLEGPDVDEIASMAAGNGQGRR